MKVYARLAQLVQARANCLKHNNDAWYDKHGETIAELVKEFMPSGSGVDSGTKFDEDGSTENKLVFQADYHHMNDGGYYDGWTQHQVIVTPDLAFGFNLKITGRNRNDIKDYLSEIFHHALNHEAPAAERVQSPEPSQTESGVAA